MYHKIIHDILFLESYEYECEGFDNDILQQTYYFHDENKEIIIKDPDKKLFQYTGIVNKIKAQYYKCADETMLLFIVYDDMDKVYLFNCADITKITSITINSNESINPNETKENNNITLQKETNDYIQYYNEYLYKQQEYADKIKQILLLDEDATIDILPDCIRITTTQDIHKREIDTLNEVFENYTIGLNSNEVIYIIAYFKKELLPEV